MLMLLFVASIVVLPICEGWSIGQAAWWFPVTVTTVGYGDLSPSSAAGRVLAVIVMTGGIGIASMAIGGALVAFTARREKEMKGLGSFTGKDHLVLLGWRGEESKRLIKEIRADKQWANGAIVVCSNSVDSKPINDCIFIKGDIHSKDVFERSSIIFARKVIIHGATDESSIFACLGANVEANSRCQIIARIKNPENMVHIQRIEAVDDNKNITCIVDSTVEMTVQEMQDKGVNHILRDLLSNQSSSTIFRVDISPDEASINEILSDLRLVNDPDVKVFNIVAVEGLDGGIYIPHTTQQVIARAVFVIADKRPEGKE